MRTNQLQQKINQHSKQNLVRQRFVVKRDMLNNTMLRGQPKINFSSNDYLSINKHPNIINAMNRAYQHYGFGSGASAQLCGYSEEHEKTENAFAKWLGVEKTLLFNSGYHANLGVISALTNRHSYILSDKYCHASIIDGMLLAKAKFSRYRHLDSRHCQQLAQQHNPDYIITESIFSMEGQLAPITAINKICKNHQAGLIIDDAHGVGVIGNSGRGIIEYCQLQDHDFTCLILPLGKAFNAMGAIVAGKTQVIDAIYQLARTYRYSTAIPAMHCAALQESLSIIKNESWRRHKLLKNIQLFIDYCRHKHIAISKNALSAIQVIMVPNIAQCIYIQELLFDSGFFIAAIRPPTVPTGQSRLRISLNCQHSTNDIMLLIDIIDKGLQKCKMM